ncbi:hypothetical protein PVAND_007068 [Polypedilum vanderplanki]|uniref:Dynein regulatory complex protein 10 n=1 Tax=Polypedilum vanderplanki TaxID=319348 RepID=A0A9J6C644_POLVA|nr:hypothetical protein PVAND_007068 [Polypedilum vanderplanki]
MSELLNIDDYFFEPDEEEEEDFSFIDPAILQQFRRFSVISIEKIQKEIFNFDEKEDEDFQSDKALRNFEFQIQVNRILQIFDELVKKIEVILCLPEFIKDHELMKKFFSEEDINQLTLYCKNRNFEINTNDPKEEEKVNRLIQTLLSSELHLYSENYKDNISLQKIIFLSSIKELRNIINSRLQLTAPKELKREQILHQIWKRYEKTKEKIATLREKWFYRKENFEEKMKNKYETIERYTKEIEILKKQNEIEINDQIEQSNVNIINFCKEKDNAIEKKYNEAEEARDAYKDLLSEDLNREKMLREQKDKAIQALQAILHKYDVEVGEERTRELEELRSALELQRKEFGIWKDTVFDPQIRLHEKLMFERAETERLEMEKQMLIFMMNRSAKILQKYWRALVSKKKKKKGRRGKKK